MGTESSGDDFLATIRSELRRLKRLGEKALAQVRVDGQLHALIDPESNSLAILIQHLAGNMRSRWTDFLTSDGEKPDRDRESEFDSRPTATRAELMAVWEEGWGRLFQALDGLTAADLARGVAIRGEPHTVVQAILRQVIHYGQHVGQIVFLAKHLQSGNWKSLSIPRGDSGKRALYEPGFDEGTPGA